MQISFLFFQTVKRLTYTGITIYFSSPFDQNMIISKVAKIERSDVKYSDEYMKEN
jgi:hypothetical protein